MTAALVVTNVVALAGLTLALLRHRATRADEPAHRALLFLLGGTWTLAVACACTASATTPPTPP